MASASRSACSRPGSVLLTSAAAAQQHGPAAEAPQIRMGRKLPSRLTRRRGLGQCSTPLQAALGGPEGLEKPPGRFVWASKFWNQPSPPEGLADERDSQGCGLGSRGWTLAPHGGAAGSRTHTCSQQVREPGDAATGKALRSGAAWLTHAGALGSRGAPSTSYPPPPRAGPSRPAPTLSPRAPDAVPAEDGSESGTGLEFWSWRENVKPERLAPELQKSRLGSLSITLCQSGPVPRLTQGDGGGDPSKPSLAARSGLGREKGPRLVESCFLTVLFLQVVAVLAVVMGTHAFSFRPLKDNFHRLCCRSKEQASEDWLKWNPVVVTPPETASLTYHEESCRASEDGPLNSRAISPWRYELDRDLDRLPQDLYHARCLCPHCVSLQTGSHMDPLGNSELLYHNQTVFYRRRCHREQGAHDGYCLERRLYPVSLACVCVRPRVMA
ncbi:PREDICTED: uncharacterized protein LOC102814762 [Chrysochloris asiatica]|uniref:Uncharacterized protein LOC102814762 n=1 Tax=Chrysochloris asiatica TaxID=185453 RepID=A0A9B0T3S4_CHRAS|nr:PREDICTED: uncharacterized protein LOC102814762 [Chrysochloris asiatica]